MEKWLKKKNLWIFAGIFLVGVLFLLFGEYHTTKENETDEQIFDETAYTEKMEARLREMIAQMTGDENAKVFITLESSAVYCYAEEESSLYSEEKSLVFRQNSGGEKTPVLKEIRAPVIRGVSVVCKGGRNDEYRYEIIRLLAGSLNVPKNRIYVTE